MPTFCFLELRHLLRDIARYAAGTAVTRQPFPSCDVQCRRQTMRKLGLLATAAVLSLAGATASRAESVIVQESATAPAAALGQQIVTERTIEPGLFGDQFIRERTVVTQP